MHAIPLFRILLYGSKILRRRRNNVGKLSSIRGAVLQDIKTAANEIKKERARKKDTHEKRDNT